MSADSAVIDALAQLGLEVERRDTPGGSKASGVLLVVEPEGVEVWLEIASRALVTDDVARRLLRSRPADGPVLVVVGDRVTAEARRELVATGAGYLDLRGHLAVRAPGLAIDADVEHVVARQTRSDALSGKAGREIAVHLLLSSGEPATVREVSRRVERSPSTVSSVLTLLREEGLIDSRNTVAGPQLFWRVVERWARPRTLLASVPPLGGPLAEPLRLGLGRDDSSVGWALTDSMAAAAYGAPVAVRDDGPCDFLVPDPSSLRRAATLLGTAASPADAAATARVAPVPAAVAHRVWSAASDWPLAHPLFVALDLAQDLGRGREILDAWTPEDKWSRVW